jgi:hypothetical protein
MLIIQAGLPQWPPEGCIREDLITTLDRRIDIDSIQHLEVYSTPQRALQASRLN